MNVNILSSNCIVTKGKSRSSLVDYQRNKLYIISNEVANIICQKPILSNSSEEVSDIIQKLIDEDIIIQIPEDEISLFTPISTEFEIPYHICDAIIDYKDNYHDVKIYKQLIQLLCPHAELRFFEKFSITYFQEILNVIEDSTLEALDVYLKYEEFAKNESSILDLINNNIRFRILYVHSCPPNTKFLQHNRIIYSEQLIHSHSHCGNISDFHFSIWMTSYLESLHYNSCLNRKVGIDINGFIKNCPSMAEHYGNITETDIVETIKKEKFQTVWSIKKDIIAGCSDCEFRYICTDCRAYTENPVDIYSKPLKCGYDPSTCLWSDWAENPLKIDAVNFYNF